MVWGSMALIGILSLTRLAVNLLPELSYPALAVRTMLPNAAPEEIESLITRPIEEAVAGIAAVEHMSSLSSEGLSLVTLHFSWNTEMNFALLELREKLDQLRWFLPQNCGRPTIIELDPSTAPMMILAVSGLDMQSTRDLSEWVIKKRLEQLEGVAMVSVTGGQEKEIEILIRPELLDAFGLRLDQVSEAVAASNYSLPGGAIRTGLFRYSLRLMGEFQTIEDIQSVVVAHQSNGARITLKQIAQIHFTDKDRMGINRLNRQEAVGLLVQKEPRGNTVAVAKTIHKVLQELALEYPFLQISEIYNQADFISASLNNVFQSIIWGALLAVLVLYLFLRDALSPLLIGISIPTSILASFPFFYQFHIQLNIMSLGGLALGIGLLVDNSIIVLENIFRHHENGEDAVSASILGTDEVVLPLLASTLTTIAVFFPVIYIKGVAGRLFRDQAFAVGITLLSSLPVAVTLLPVLAAHFLHHKNSHVMMNNPRLRKVSRRRLNSDYFYHRYPLMSTRLKICSRLVRNIRKSLDRIAQRLFQDYEKLLNSALLQPKRTVLAAGLALFISLLASSLIPRELMPPISSDELMIEINLPKGSTLERVTQVTADLETIVLQTPHVVSVFSQIGIARFGNDLAAENQNMESCRLRIKIDPEHSTDKVYDEIMSHWLKPVECEIIHKAAENIIQQLFTLTPADLSIRISGEDLTVLQEIAQKIKTFNIPTIREFWTPNTQGTPEFRLTIDREKAGRYGLHPKEILDEIHHHLDGILATQYNEFNRKIDVMVRSAPTNDAGIQRLLNETLRRGNVVIPLRTVIQYKIDRSPMQIRRDNQVRQLALYATMKNRSFKKAVAELEAKCSQIVMPPGYSVHIGGVNEEMKKSFGNLLTALILAVALVYMILAAQFESLFHPFIIILSIPLALIGVIWILLLSGLRLNALSFIGIIVLTGIAVNDAILKVSCINQLRDQGMELHSAIL